MESMAESQARQFAIPYKPYEEFAKVGQECSRGSLESNPSKRDSDAVTMDQIPDPSDVGKRGSG